MSPSAILTVVIDEDPPIGTSTANAIHPQICALSAETERMNSRFRAALSVVVASASAMAEQIHATNVAL